jgi:hypothetical protein
MNAFTRIPALVVLAALQNALPILASSRPDRAKAVLEALSDLSEEPAETAAIQGAHGAPRPA